MSFDFVNYRETKNLYPHTFEDKETYYQDLGNIEWGMTGRIDAMFANKFFYEAVQLIQNSIVLFEKGFFDCSFYSLRQSLEISTTSIYLVDDDDLNNRKAEMNKWRKEERFPQQGKMLQELEKRKSDYADVKEKMSDFFKDLEKAKQKMNKYVHKQGYDKFYTYHENTFSEMRESRLRDFLDFLNKSIGAVAVMRLVIDPMPLLLLDEEIYCRTGELMTENYSNDFIEKYIGEKHIEAYKETEIYKGYYHSLMNNEKMLPCVVSVVKDQFIEREKLEEIFSQVHLLNVQDRVAVAFANLLPELVNVYCYGGLLWYFTDTERIKSKTSFNSADFIEFKGKANSFNHNYQDTFISVLSVDDEEYYLEHNTSLNEEKIALVELFLSLIKNNNDEVKKDN